MPGPTVQRTIVKSKPEVWSEVSDVASLARHLAEFGEITITRVTPETTVAWEGDRVRGTVTLERSGWGTKVTVTAEAADVVAAPQAAADVTEVAAPAAEPEQPVANLGASPADEPPAGEDEAPRLRWWQRIGRHRRRQAQSPGSDASVASVTPEPEAPEPEPEPEPVPVPEPEPELREDAEQILSAMLDHIGAAHHRPFSRG